MSFPKSCNLLKRVLSKQIVLFNQMQKRGHFYKDYKPARCPPVGRDAILDAAHKYNLLPIEYKCFPPEDGTGYGDYPDIPAISGEARDPFYPWDNPELKRNFNEVLHVDEDMIGEDRVNINARFKKTLLRMVIEFVVVMASFISVYLWLNDKKMFLPLLPKQYPGHGKCKHYTFEQVVKDKECICPY